MTQTEEQKVLMEMVKWLGSEAKDIMELEDFDPKFREGYSAAMRMALIKIASFAIEAGGSSDSD